jgi:hypothetical protein
MNPMILMNLANAGKNIIGNARENEEMYLSKSTKNKPAAQQQQPDQMRIGGNLLGSLLSKIPLTNYGQGSTTIIG